MNLLTLRIPTVLGLLLIVALIVGSFYYFTGKTTKVNKDLIPTKVRITNISDNKFSVSWITGTITVGSIEYGIVGEKLTTVAKDDLDAETQGQYITHHVTVEGLQPSTEYAFRILSGKESVRYDNNGSPYTTTTGPVIGTTPSSQNFYGNAQLPSKQSAKRAIVYLTLPGGATVSTLVRESGNYAFTLSTIRADDLRSYVKYDPSATIASIMIENGDLQSISSVSLANSAPVPTITLGKNEDYLNLAQTPPVAVVLPGQTPATASAIPSDNPAIPTTTPQPLGIFNVEPLNDINAVTTTTVTILNPRDIGEILTTLQPEFRGTGPVGTTLSIALTGQKAISDTTQVLTDGTWSWSPVIDLKIGKQKIAVSYVGTGGITQKIEREFYISPSKTGLDPAFVSSPSASTIASPAGSPSTTPRAAMPATDTGVPVTGVIENTLLTVTSGIVIMVVGVVLLLL